MWYAGKQVAQEIKEANSSRRKFSPKKLVQAEHIHSCLNKSKKALDSIPSDIAPETFLRKFKNWYKQNILTEPI